MTDILVTTRGRSWQVVPELIGFTNPDIVNLYKYHAENIRIAHQRFDYRITPIDEFWVITTLSELSTRATLDIHHWYTLLETSNRPAIKFWQVENTKRFQSSLYFKRKPQPDAARCRQTDHETYSG